MRIVLACLGVLLSTFIALPGCKDSKTGDAETAGKPSGKAVAINAESEEDEKFDAAVNKWRRRAG